MIVSNNFAQRRTRMSFMLRQLSSLPRSYRPLRSIKSLSSAMGCCVPYVSTRGMLRSSRNMMSFLPMGGPYVSLLRFSVLSSMARCTSMEEVRLEKLMLRMMLTAGSRWFR